MADLAFDHLQSPDECFVGGAAGVRFGAEARGNALVARNEFGQILADELADIGGRWGRWLECLELRGEQVELNADAVAELAGRRGQRGALGPGPELGGAGELLKVRQTGMSGGAGKGGEGRG